ncbi:MAG: hypothetical protein ACREQ5_14075, partial [Candidatus Dormibacteria bacterium]
PIYSGTLEERICRLERIVLGYTSESGDEIKGVKTQLHEYAVLQRAIILWTRRAAVSVVFLTLVHIFNFIFPRDKDLIHAISAFFNN